MNVVEIVFSPTGGTEKVANIIGKAWSENAVKIDLSDPKTDFTKCKIPPFGGRAPATAIERLKQIAGNGANCTLVCVYGKWQTLKNVFPACAVSRSVHTVPEKSMGRWCPLQLWRSKRHVLSGRKTSCSCNGKHLSRR